MKTIIITVLTLIVSIASGIWINSHMTSRYFIEEYYMVQNLDPKNEKNAEVLRQKVQALMQKNIPSKYRPTADKFQCFKIISESVFFCSVDTYRKKVAQRVKKLLQVTVPQEVGWIPAEEVSDKVSYMQGEINSNQAMIEDFSKQLEKIKKKSNKQDAQIKKFMKTDDLFKKTLSLLDRKKELLKSLIEQATNPDIRSSYQLSLEETQSTIDDLNRQHASFRSQSHSFAESAQQRDMLIQQIDDLKQANTNEQKNLDLIQVALAQPNEIGKVADVNEFQLIPDLPRQKFEEQKKESTAIWFTLAIFFVLTNFVFRLRPNRMVPFQEDMTMTEQL